MNLAPTYQDYLASNPHYSDENGQSVSNPISEAEWNKLSPDQQWKTIGGVFGIAAGDPRFQGIFSQIARPGDEASRGITVTQGSMDPQYLVDPSRALSSDGAMAYLPQNETPASQARANAGGLSSRAWSLMPLALLGGGLGANYLMSGSLLGGSGAASALPDSYWSALASGGNVATDALPEGAAIDESAGLNMASPFSAAATQAPLSSSFSALLSNPSLSNAGSLLGSAGSYALAHPLTALGVAQMAGGLLHQPSAPSSSGGGNKSSSGAVPMNIQRPQWTPNPYTMAQLAKYNAGGL